MRSTTFLRWRTAPPLLLQLLQYAGWLCRGARAQLGEAVTGSVSFLDAGVTSMGNLAAFTTSFLRGRLDLELGARDLLAILRGPPLRSPAREGSGAPPFSLATDTDLQAASVVMISTLQASSTVRHFMRYASLAHNVDSVLLRCVLLGHAGTEVPVERCMCGQPCRCLVFWASAQITLLIALRMPGTLKRLSESLYLLPSLHCLRAGCHGCSHGLLHVDNLDGPLVEGRPQLEPPAAACHLLDALAAGSLEDGGGHKCLCIPLGPPNLDEWSRLLARMIKTQDEHTREVHVAAFDALSGYVEGSRSAFVERVDYTVGSLVLPRSLEVAVNGVLSTWFRVDGLSSAMAARRAVRDYVVDSRGNGFFAGAFFTHIIVDCTATSSHACHAVSFRGPLLNVATLSWLAGVANVACTAWWMGAVALGKGLGRWSSIYAHAPNLARLVAVLVALGIGLGMDCWHLYLNRFRWRELCRLWLVIVVEMMAIGMACALLAVIGVSGFGRWVYSALAAIVWMKWAFGSYLLGEYLDDESRWSEGGILVYSSAFLLNAILAGAGGKWE